MTMYVTREELIKSRISLLKDMTKYILSLNNDDALMIWENYVVALGADDAEYHEIASDNIWWKEACKWFGSLVNR